MIHVIPKHSTHSTKQCGFGYFRSALDDTGHYGSGNVEAVDDCLEKIEVGKFAAVHLANYDKVPVIGKVLEVSESMVKIHYWKI